MSSTARTDIYSLGVVLYEMLAGETPFGGATAQAMIARRLTETPRPLRAIRETISEPVEQAVAKALARTAADRYRHGGRVRVGFGECHDVPLRPDESPRGRSREPQSVGYRPRRRSSSGCSSAWACCSAGSASTTAAATRPRPAASSDLPCFPSKIWAARRTSTSRTGSPTKSVASSPRSPVSRSPRPAARRSTRSPPRRHSRSAKSSACNTSSWARSAGRKADGQSRVRVSPELVQTSTASTKWQQPFDAGLTDVFQVQADVASRVAQALDVALGAGEKEALAGKPTRTSPPTISTSRAMRRRRIRRGRACGTAAGHRLLRARRRTGLYFRARLGPALPRAHLHPLDRCAHDCRRGEGAGERRSERLRCRPISPRGISPWVITTT